MNRIPHEQFDTKLEDTLRNNQIVHIIENSKIKLCDEILRSEDFQKKINDKLNTKRSTKNHSWRSLFFQGALKVAILAGDELNPEHIPNHLITSDVIGNYLSLGEKTADALNLGFVIYGSELSAKELVEKYSNLIQNKAFILENNLHNFNKKISKKNQTDIITLCSNALENYYKSFIDKYSISNNENLPL